MKLARAGVAVGVMVLAGPSAAQVIIGGDTDGQPSVVIDQGVLDALGPSRGFAPPSPYPATPGAAPAASAPSHPVDLRPAPARPAVTVAQPPSWRPPLPGRRPDPEVAVAEVTESPPDDTVGVDPPDMATDIPAPAAEPSDVVAQREPDQAGMTPAEPAEDAPSTDRSSLTVLTQPLGAGLLVNNAPPPEAEDDAAAPPEADVPDEAAAPVAPPPAETPAEPNQTADQVAELPNADTVAAAPPAEPPSTDLTLSIPFDVGADSLGEEALDLLGDVVDRMTASPEPRLSIVAYATGDAGTARNARSLSLTRALAVREYLMTQGVRLTRIDMRALGDTADDDPRDRIDLELNY